MKKAILIVGIIWIAISLTAAILEVTYGIGMLIHLENGPVDWQPNVPLGVANIIVGVYYVISIALTVVLIIKRNSSMTRGKGIALGVVAAVLGSLVPGVLFIVDSAMNRE